MINSKSSEPAGDQPIQPLDDRTVLNWVFAILNTRHGFELGDSYMKRLDAIIHNTPPGRVTPGRER